MAFYADEEEVWKCPKHPSKRRRTCGVCPACLRDRLSALCPDCARALPCACSSTSATSSSPTSSSSSLSCFSSDVPPCSAAGVRVSTLIAAEPAFRRSRSVAAIPFLRSRFSGEKPPVMENRSKSSIWSVFKTQKSKKEKINNELSDNCNPKMILTRSRSVAVDATPSPGKGKGWYFPSPMKAFRQTKSSKVVQERSPLYRG